MPKVKPELFEILNDEKVESTLYRLYKEAVKQIKSVLLHFLPKAFQFFGKGIDWKTENESFFDDKYISIEPAQGTLLYMHARALRAKRILEFGTSYGISTIYLAKAAKENGGKVITTEYLSHKAKVAFKNLEEAGLSDFVEIREGDALETLKDINEEIDFVLLDGWPNLAYPILKLIEPKLKIGAVIFTDNAKGFQVSMQDYFSYVKNPKNGYLSTTIKVNYGVMEYTIKVK